MPKSVPISVRLSEGDVEFLARFEAPGAITPSEKLRSILSDARKRHEGTEDVEDSQDLVREMLRPSERALRKLQRSENVRSDFVMKLYERLPEILAELMAGVPGQVEGGAGLREFEARLAEEMFSLIEEVFDLGLTSQGRTYDPTLIRDRLKPVLEILKLYEISQKTLSDKGK